MFLGSSYASLGDRPTSATLFRVGGREDRNGLGSTTGQYPLYLHIQTRVFHPEIEPNITARVQISLKTSSKQREHGGAARADPSRRTPVHEMHPRGLTTTGLRKSRGIQPTHHFSIACLPGITVSPSRG